MGNINYLNFRKCPKDEDLIRETRAFLDRVFPNLSATVEKDDWCCLRVVFHSTRKDKESWFEYYRYSRRRIGTKAPRTSWSRWVWYLIRCHLIALYGGTCRDECDMTDTEDLELTRYPTFSVWLDSVHPNYVSHWTREEWVESGRSRLSYAPSLVAEELRRKEHISRIYTAAEELGYPMEANL